jgi:hypothetical protein
MVVYGSVVAICLELHSYKHMMFRCTYEDLIARSVSYEYEQLILLPCSFSKFVPLSVEELIETIHQLYITLSSGTMALLTTMIFGRYFSGTYNYGSPFWVTSLTKLVINTISYVCNTLSFVLQFILILLNFSECVLFRLFNLVGSVGSVVSQGDWILRLFNFVDGFSDDVSNRSWDEHQLVLR